MAAPEAPSWSPAVAEVVDHRHEQPFVSALWVYGGLTGLPALLLVWLVARLVVARVRQQLAQRAETRATAEPAPGKAVVRGTVVDIEGGGPAVRWAATFTGTPFQKEDGSEWLEWDKFDRSLEVRPFYLETEGGQRIRVEPDDDTQLVDDLGPGQRQGDRMVRAAELTEGEQAYALGELVGGQDPRAGRGYRGAGEALILRPPRRGPMRLSTKPLTHPFAREVRLRLLPLLVLLVATLVGHGLLAPFHAAIVLGQTEAARVVERTHRQWSGRGGRTQAEAHVTFEVVSSGRLDRKQVSGEVHAVLAQGTVFPVTTFHLFGPRATLGTGPTASSSLLWTETGVLAVLILLGVVDGLTRRAWYQGGSVRALDEDES